MACLRPIAAALFVLAAGCAREETNAPPQALIELSDQFSGDFALIDQHGRAVTDEDFRGKLALVYFGFASCPDVCPMALSRLSAALNDLSKKQQDLVTPLFITVDPERDTPQALKAFLAFDPRIVGLTGDAEAIEGAKRAFKVYAQRQRLPGSALDYTVNHSSFYYLVDKAGRPRVAVDDSLTPQELAAVLRLALRGRY